MKRKRKRERERESNRRKRVISKNEGDKPFKRTTPCLLLFWSSVASRVGIENTSFLPDKSSEPRGRRQEIPSSRASSRSQWRAAERVRGVGVARGNTILSAPALKPATR